MTTYPRLRNTVLDAVDAAGLAAFYVQMFGWRYVDGVEPDPADDWINLATPDNHAGIAIQRVDELPRATWPSTEVPQQLHLDFLVDDLDDLARQRERAIELGATVLLDFTDEREVLHVMADPEGHPFCLFAWLT